jgi:hypothetical protein
VSPKVADSVRRRKWKVLSLTGRAPIFGTSLDGSETVAHQETKAGLIMGGPEIFELQMQILRERILTHQYGPEIVPKKSPALLETCMQAILHFGPAVAFERPEELYFPKASFEKLGLAIIEDPVQNSLPIYPDLKPSQEQITEAMEEIGYWSSLTGSFVLPWVRHRLNLISRNPVVSAALRSAFVRDLSPKEESLFAAVAPEIALRLCYQEVDEVLQWLEERGIPDRFATLFAAGNRFDDNFTKFLLVTVNNAKVALTESQARGLPVLSRVVRPTCRPHHLKSSVGAGMQVLKIALSAEGYEMPRIVTVSNLVTLLRERRVLEFQKLIREFGESLFRGDLQLVPRISARIRKSARELARLSRAQKVMRWRWMIPVGVGVLELLHGHTPEYSILAELGVEGANEKLRQAQEKRSWLSLLRHRLSINEVGP